jgi:hypothetical protein
MLRNFSILIIILICSFKGMAQDSSLFNSSWADSIRASIQDSIKKHKNVNVQKAPSVTVAHDTANRVKKQDSLARVTKKDSSVQTVSNTLNDSTQVVMNDSLRSDSIAAVITANRNDSLAKASAKIKRKVVQPPGMPGLLRSTSNNDLIFYVLIFIILLLALIKKSFPKYFNSIFSLSFQATFRQTQTREHMSQNFFPAFMLNVLFILSGGMFVTLFAQFYKFTSIPFWQLFIYATTMLALVYLVKYFVIVFAGWVFNAPEAATDYRFIVFLINKLIGIFFIPILFVIAYTGDDVKKIAITVALCVAGLLLALRYLISLVRIRKNLNLTAFHFFIYLCAVEIMPLLVLYKLLFIKTANT